MTEIDWFDIDEDTEPSFETDVAKWYLLRKGEHYAVWRWDSKKDVRNKEFVITDLRTNNVINTDHLVEGIFTKFEIFERTYDE